MNITTFAQRLRLLATELDQLQSSFTVPLMIEKHNGSWQIFDEQGEDIHGYASIEYGTVEMDQLKGR